MAEDRVRAILVELIEAMHGDLTDRPNIEPTHGNCCTCQTCGYSHDECVCANREWIKGIDQATAFIKELMLEMVGGRMNGDCSGGIEYANGYNQAKHEIRERIENS